MPFIWDDFDWKLVDDQDPYDKNRFVVARKLCVTPNRGNKEFLVELIRRHFRKFGEIESIELLPNDYPEAYVTFVNDHSACLAQSCHQCSKMMNKEEPYLVELAYTWEQPPQNVNPTPQQDMEVDDEQTAEIFTLNEDCLLHLFRFLDLGSLVNMADVCKMFNQLLHHHCFPRIRKYEVSCDPKYTLAQTHRELLCIGRHITDLSFRAHYKKHFDGYIDDDRSLKFLNVIVQNVGQNIRRADLKFGFNNPDRIKSVAPILRNLESLEIGDWCEITNYDIDFPTLCPNLIDLTINIDMAMIDCCEPWPSLRSLMVMHNEELDRETLMSIIEQNPQLTSMGFAVRSNNNIALFTTITKHLTALEKLTIYFDQLSSNYAENFNVFEELSRLCEINFYNLKVSKLKGVIDHLRKFTNLRKIMLGGTLIHSKKRNYGQSLVNLGKHLSRLGELYLTRIPMKEGTLVDIVRFGRQLKVLRICDCELVVSDELIFKLVDALKYYRHESNGALQFFLPQRDLDKLDAAKNKEIERYLRLKRA